MALAQDPVLSAKVLRLANSAFFGGQRSMASIDAAVALIGLQALNRLIVACGVAAPFKEIPGIDLKVFWRDALVAGIAANKLAPRLSADAEEAYTCGLLHGTGHLILCQTYPDIANAMFSGFEVVRGVELATIEAGAFGIDHPAVGALWVESLGFPQPVADTIRCVAEPVADSEAPLLLTLRSASALAASVAQKDAGRGRAGRVAARRPGALQRRRPARRRLRQALRGAAGDRADVLSGSRHAVRLAAVCKRGYDGSMSDMLALSAHLPEVEFAAGDVVVHEGGSAGSLWVLVSGALQGDQGPGRWSTPSPGPARWSARSRSCSTASTAPRCERPSERPAPRRRRPRAAGAATRRSPGWSPSAWPSG